MRNKARALRGEMVKSAVGGVTGNPNDPSAITLDARAQRLELLDQMGNDCTALALEITTSIKAENSLEEMLCHQLAVAHKTVFDITGKAGFERDSVGQARLLSLAARFMDVYQRGLLTVQRLRVGGEQTIIVKQVTVTDGGQAVVGSVRSGGGESK